MHRNPGSAEIDVGLLGASAPIVCSIFAFGRETLLADTTVNGWTSIPPFRLRVFLATAMAPGKNVYNP